MTQIAFTQETFLILFESLFVQKNQVSKFAQKNH